MPALPQAKGLVHDLAAQIRVLDGAAVLDPQREEVQTRKDVLIAVAKEDLLPSRTGSSER